MSATFGPCPYCGNQTMYYDRTPTACAKCLNEVKAIIVPTTGAALSPGGNRQQRRALKSRKKGTRK